MTLSLTVKKKKKNYYSEQKFYEEYKTYTQARKQKIVLTNS